MTKVIIVGCDGQDGSYLRDQLATEGVETILVGRSTLRVPGAAPRSFDITDAADAEALVAIHRPDEIYYLAAYHHSSEQNVGDEGELFRASWALNTAAPVTLLSAVGRHSPGTRVVFAASSRIFGTPAQAPQTEETPIDPRCAYGITKAATVFHCRDVRRRGLFASVAILYNHESPRRPRHFLSRKVAAGAAACAKGTATTLRLGSLSATADWGFAGDYTAAMRRIARHDRPGDFIVASGRSRTVQDLVEVAFAQVGLDWRRFVTEDASLLKGPAPRQAAVVGDPSRLMAATGWQPAVGFEEMIALMVNEEMRNG
ncbi:MAG: GDP-mannose 4,6-dehydratase [Magnetospirillum sp.]|nr:GDP-mannose 4,6-dehydratase [Magnetospirillum sp.]